MNFLDLVDISERYMALVNPSTPEKILQLGRRLQLGKGSRVIDFGCGYAEPLVLWAENFGISGVGLELRENACRRARERIAGAGLEERLQIVCGDAAEYEFEPGSYDAATCLGASFIWGDFRAAIQAMRPAIGPGGRLAIGEPYWLRDEIPPGYARQEQHPVRSEYELRGIIREEGFYLEGIVRASHEDWDRYESDNWYGLIRWLEDNPDHPERGDVLRHLHDIQDEYLRYVRQNLGWAIFVLKPV